MTKLTIVSCADIQYCPIVQTGSSKAFAVMAKSTNKKPDEIVEHYFYQKIQLPLFIQINLQEQVDHSKTLTKLVKLLKRFNRSAESVKLIMTNLGSIANKEEVLNWCNLARSLGFSHALSDFGFCKTSLLLFQKIQPETLFIAPDIADQVAKSPHQQSYIEFSVRFASDFNCLIVAENVSSEDEFDCLTELGVSRFSGPLFCTEQKESKLTGIHSELLKQPNFYRSANEMMIGEMVEMALVLPPHISMEEAEQELIAKSKTMAVIVYDEEPLGLIYKTMIDRKFSQRLGRELFDKRPVSLFMDQRALQVSENTPIEVVAKRLGKFGNTEYLGQHFFITRDNKYLGIGTARNLLEWITNIRIEQASYITH
jgi:EAL domain-containing protein (putative c-di-GMP-specific phosphodiesterase class I)